MEAKKSLMVLPEKERVFTLFAVRETFDEVRLSVSRTPAFITILIYAAVMLGAGLWFAYNFAIFDVGVFLICAAVCFVFFLPVLLIFLAIVMPNQSIVINHSENSLKIFNSLLGVKYRKKELRREEISTIKAFVFGRHTNKDTEFTVRGVTTILLLSYLGALVRLARGKGRRIVPAFGIVVEAKEPSGTFAGLFCPQIAKLKEFLETAHKYWPDVIVLPDDATKNAKFEIDPNTLPG